GRHMGSAPGNSSADSGRIPAQGTSTRAHEHQRSAGSTGIPAQWRPDRSRLLKNSILAQRNPPARLADARIPHLVRSRGLVRRADRVDLRTVELIFAAGIAWACLNLWCLRDAERNLDRF